MPSGVFHHGRKPAVFFPTLRHIAEVIPEPDRQSRGVRRAEHGRLGDCRADHRKAEHVGLELHQHLVAHHAAVDFERRQFETGVGFHRFEHVTRLIGNRLQSRPGDVAGTAVARESGDHAPGVCAPVRCEQAAECGDEVHIAVVVDGSGKALDLGGGPNQTKVVTQPLHGRAGHSNRAFERVLRRVGACPVGDGRKQPPVRRHGIRPGVEKHEAAGAVGVLGVSGGEATLTEQRRLLITENAGHRYAGERSGLDAVDTTDRRHDFGQRAARNAESGKKVFFPVQRNQVHQHRPARVGDIGDMAPRQLPDQPRINRAKPETLPFRRLGNLDGVVEQPAHLGTGEICGEGQAGTRPESVRTVVSTQLPAQFSGAGVLPHDRRREDAAVVIPGDRGLALVGDADRSYAGRIDSRPLEAGGDDGFRVAPDLIEIVLDPAGTRKVLGVLLLGGGDKPAVVTDEHAPRARCPLIDGRHISVRACHAPAPISPARRRAASPPSATKTSTTSAAYCTTRSISGRSFLAKRLST